jgi:hypothetical protein
VDFLLLARYIKLPTIQLSYYDVLNK